MTRARGSGHRSPVTGRVAAVLLGLTPVLLLLSPLIEALGTLGIPLFVTPSLLLAAWLTGIGLVLGASLVATQPGVRRSSLRDLAFAVTLSVVILAVLDLVVGGGQILQAVVPDTFDGANPAIRRLARAVALVLGLTLLTTVLWLVRRYVAGPLSVAAIVLFTITVGTNPRVFQPEPAFPRETAAESDLPPLVFIVFDEALGIEGLRRAPGGEGLADQIRTTLVQHGFRVYGAAFSRHPTTIRSIPAALDFDFTDNRYGMLVSPEGDDTTSSRLFASAAAAGYQVVVYDTEHIDFCFAQAERCERLPSFNPYSSYVAGASLARDPEVSEDDRRALMALHFLLPSFGDSHLMHRYIGFLAGRFGGPLPAGAYAVDLPAFPRWFERFEADVVTAPRGRAYFAHLLMPHAPYVLDGQCAETGRSDTGHFLTEQHGLTGLAFDERRRELYVDYVQQYRCAMARLDGLLARLSRVPAFSDATIVVMGDHGARISAGLAGPLDERDLVDNHSTLFAIRRPGVAPGYDRRFTSIQRLTAEFLSGLGPAALGVDNSTVVLDTATPGVVELRPMPRFGDGDDTGSGGRDERTGSARGAMAERNGPLAVAGEEERP